MIMILPQVKMMTSPLALVGGLRGNMHGTASAPPRCGRLRFGTAAQS